MECSKQGYWSIEYRETSNFLVDSTANNNYSRFAKRQFHKARRRHDRKIIEEHLKGIMENRTMTMRSFSSSPAPHIEEHNHKYKIKEAE